MDVVEKEILKIKNGKKEKIFDSIVVEKQINIYLNNNLTFRLMCLPTDLEFFLYGFFFSNRYIDEPDEIKNLKIINNNCFVEIDKKITNKIFTLGSSCFSSFFSIDDIVGTSTNRYIEIQKYDIIKIMNKFQKMSKIYKQTGAIHSAAVTDGENIHFLSEDIGRHNAVDKVVGKIILNRYDTENRILLTSGRISSEIVFKAKRANIAAIVSFSAPTSLAIEVAEKFKILLIGFARGKRYNVYTTDAY